MKQWKNLVASNEVEEQILDYASKMSKISKQLYKMSDSLIKIQDDQEEVSEVFKDLLEELSEASFKSAIDLSIVTRYGKLVVLSQLPKEGKYYIYLCKCDCGNTIEVKAENLKSGKVKSCGCLKNAPARNRLPDRKDAILRREYSSIKKRNRKFTDYDNVISYDEYKSIVNAPCNFCGCVGSRSINDRLRSRGKTHICSDEVIHINGIDRIDSSKGYISGNCISCCTTCNYAKNTMSIEQFKTWIRRVYEHYCK